MWHDREDPGLQPERTELAWHRTMISFFAAALLVVRWADRFGGLAVAVVSVACAAAVFIRVRTRRRARAVAPTFPDAPVPVAALEVVVLTTATLLLGVLGFWLLLGLTGPP